MGNACLKALSDLDLEPIVIKAMDQEEGLGWSIEHACQVEKEYRRFLVLCMNDEHNSVVPSSDVDEFWHLHILDTQKYAHDCEEFLGFFLHHFPYFGMRGEDDEKNLHASWLDTLVRYEQTFGEKPSPTLWEKSNRCPRCGRRAPSASELRPSFESMGIG